MIGLQIRWLQVAPEKISQHRHTRRLCRMRIDEIHNHWLRHSDSYKLLCHPERSRRTPCSSNLLATSQGILPMRLRWKCLSRFVVALAGKGSFDSLRTSRREVLTPLRMTAYLVLIDSPANTICASHFSARSAQRGFFDSISAIFFLLTHLFSCFSRSIAFLTSSKPS